MHHPGIDQTIINPLNITSNPVNNDFAVLFGMGLTVDFRDAFNYYELQKPFIFPISNCSLLVNPPSFSLPPY